MTREDFERQTFNCPRPGDSKFILDTSVKNENIDRQLAHLRRCFEYEKADFDMPSSILHKLWVKAKDINDFKRLIIETKEARLTQFAAELMKNDWHFLRSLQSDKKFTTRSDTGNVKIGNDHFTFMVPSGDDDSEIRCSIFENKKDFNSSAFDFITSINGKFFIYSYDCGENIAASLKGKYGVYAKSGFVCFEKWEE